MRALVTGGAGFIGSNIVDELISRGHQVGVIDNESAEENDRFYWNDRADNYKYDICDYNKIKSLFKNIDCVFHLAAQSRIQPTIENPIGAVKVNCIGTTNVLQAARKHKVNKQYEINCTVCNKKTIKASIDAKYCGKQCYGIARRRAANKKYKQRK